MTAVHPHCPKPRDACRPLISEVLWERAPQTPALRYHEAAIEVAQPVEIHEGIVLARLPLPFALNHINVYLLDERDGWTLIDCGLDTPASREAWETVLSSRLVAGRPVRRIVVTHHHPDHVGLAGWLAARFGAPVFMTPGERAVAGRYADPSRDVVAERSAFWHEHGLPASLIASLLERMPRYSKHVHALPPEVRLVEPREEIRIGGRGFRAIIGRGHSPQHLSLCSAEGDVLLAGDQVLPQITPNIAVWPAGDANPLRSYLESLNGFHALGADPLVLPSHRQPFRGMARRIEELRQHHEDRLQALRQACSGPMTCYELLPALFGRPLRNEEMGFGVGEGVAHLNFLESEGRLASALDARGVRCYAPVSPEDDPT